MPKNGMRNERTKRRGNYDYKGVWPPNEWMTLPGQISMHNLKLAPHTPAALLYSSFQENSWYQGGIGEGGLCVEVYENEMSVM